MDKFTFTSQPLLLSLFLTTSFLLLLSFTITTTNVLNPSTTSTTNVLNPSTTTTIFTSTDDCTALHDYTNYDSKCSYVISHSSCWSKGYINYVQIFYCNLGHVPNLAYAIFLLWLVLLFYLLGNTASYYFCPSVESLSKTLNLPPIIAGTTLLPFGNGANDVFSSIVSFTRSEDGDFGINSILGGAFFISTFIVGVISILISSKRVKVDQSSFIRDVVFFIFSLIFLLSVIIVGKINLWVSICFVSIYIVYICLVCGMHFLDRNRDTIGEMGGPLLVCVDKKKPILLEEISDSDQEFGDGREKKRCLNLDSSIGVYLNWLLYALSLPLHLPRRFTIPIVSEERWSKPMAVISVTLAPILLGTVWNTQRENMGSKTSIVIYMACGILGLVLGNCALEGTKKSNPPRTFLLPWLVGGFVMSVTWTYIAAEELVSLLVSLGIIIGISPSILGLTVLAWGNSVGDLISNVAMAMKGGPDGVQIAISGCYAGPMFNTLVGLGLSLVFASWKEYPACYVIPIDPSLYETLGFLMLSLLWALVVLPRRKMGLDRFLGCGLLGIYLCFLFIRFAGVFGLL